MRISLLTLFLVCVFSAGCKSPSSDGSIEILARIKDYQPIQERLWLNDGTTYTFDRVAIEILEPDAWKRTTLTADHELNYRTDIEWNTEGLRIAFRIDQSLLRRAKTNNEKLHTSDFQEIRIVDRDR